MNSLRNMSISRRLWLILIVAVLMLMALGLLMLKQIHDDLYQAKRQQTLLVTPVSKKNGLLSLTKAGVTRNIKTLKALGVKSDSSLFDLSVLKDVFKGKSSL